MEREYIIPLREKCRVVPRYRKSEKAIKTIKEFIAKHMKVKDRDLTKVRLDSYVNELVWSRGIKNPPHKIKVKAIKEGEIVRVGVVELPARLKFKKQREENVSKKAVEAVKKKKTLLEKAAEAKKEKEESKTEEQKTDEADKKTEAEEKKSAVVEAGKAMEKAAAKQMKHQKGGKKKEPKIHRMALQK
ncbi:MAG: 50S ribosomal protein L31e [Nanoarchaeota archaeon]|nr:50S ribosomal protein L31e [Nanoarchaeota archaeon]